MGRRKVGEGIWEVRYQVRRRFRRKSLAMRFEDNLRSSLAEADRCARAGVAPDAPCCSIRERLDEFLSDSAAGLGRKPCAPRTVRRHRARLLAFNRAFRSATLDRISRAMVERWMKRRLKRVRPDTVNADLGSLRAFVRWAQRKKYAPAVLELMLVERLHERGKLAGTNRRPPQALGMGEMLRIIRKIAARRDDVALFLRGMALFGLRPKAVADLRRRDALLPRDGEPGKLRCAGLKGRPDRDIPVAAGSAHERWLRECLGLGNSLKASRLGGPLVPRRVGKTGSRRNGWTPAGFGMALRRVCRPLKIRFRAYQVRHTCIAWMQAQGFSLAAVAAYADHGKITTQAAYSHLRLREGLEAFEKVGEIMD